MQSAECSAATLLVLPPGITASFTMAVISAGLWSFITKSFLILAKLERKINVIEDTVSE